jgi:hypothetical protein
MPRTATLRVALGAIFLAAFRRQRASSSGPTIIVADTVNFSGACHLR